MSSFLWKDKKVMWKLVLQNDEFPEVISQLARRFNLVTDEISNYFRLIHVWTLRLQKWNH